MKPEPFLVQVFEAQRVTTLQPLPEGAVVPAARAQTPGGVKLDEALTISEGAASSDPVAAATGLLDELVSRSANKTVADRARSLIKQSLMICTAAFCAVAIPCDAKNERFVPPSSVVDQMASGLAEAHEVSVYGQSVSYDSHRFGPMRLCIYVFATRGTSPPVDKLVSELSAAARNVSFGATYGAVNIIDLIVESFIGSAAGTAGSSLMGGVLRSFGGPKRLDRVFRKYDAAMRRGDQQAADRMMRKIERIYPKITGQPFNLDEIHAAMRDYKAKRASISTS